MAVRYGFLFMSYELPVMIVRVVCLFVLPFVFLFGTEACDRLCLDPPEPEGCLSNDDLLAIPLPILLLSLKSIDYATLFDLKE